MSPCLMRWIVEPAFNEPPPECVGGIASRDNHNGNVRNGHPQYYLWKIPEHIKGRVVLRIRYNISTGDFGLGSLANPEEEGTSLSGIKADPFFMDRSFNDPNPNDRRRNSWVYPRRSETSCCVCISGACQMHESAGGGPSQAVLPCQCPSRRRL